MVHHYSIASSVSQGSVLCPLHFHIYNKDFEIGIKSKFKSFADDTMMYSVASDPLQTASDLNH